MPGLQEFAGSVSTFKLMLSTFLLLSLYMHIFSTLGWLATTSIACALQVWARRQNSSSGQDPLDHIFSEFDEDGDGYLDATDVTSALCSRNVNITPEQAQMFLEGRPQLQLYRKFKVFTCNLNSNGNC